MRLSRRRWRLEWTPAPSLLALRLCLLAGAFAFTVAAAAAARQSSSASDAFLAAVLSLGPASKLKNRAIRSSAASPVELTRQLVDSLDLCPGDSDSAAVASRLDTLSAAWLRVGHCAHLPLAAVLPMFPRQPNAEPLLGVGGAVAKEFNFDVKLPSGGCSVLLLDPADALRALMLASDDSSSVDAAVTLASSAATTLSSSSSSSGGSASSGLYNSSSSIVGSFIEDSPLPMNPQPQLASALLAQSAPAQTLNLSRLICQCAQAILHRSEQLRSVSNHFNGLLNQMYFKARSAQSQQHLESLKRCRAAYTGWLCSVYFSVHNTSREVWTARAARGRFADAANSALMRPCPDWCQAVETECPYLSPSEEVSNAGEPLFLCHEDSYKGAGFTDRCRESDCCCYKPLSGLNSTEIRFTGCKSVPAPELAANLTGVGNFTDQLASSSSLATLSRCQSWPPSLLLLSLLLSLTALCSGSVL